MFANAANLVALLTVATTIAPAFAAPLAPGRSTYSGKARPASNVNERSLKAVGIAVAGGVASGAAGAIASSLLDRRSEASGLVVDTETGVIYMNTPDVHEGRSLKAVGIAVAGGIASGAAGAIASDLLGKRSELSGLMVDTETGVIYVNTPDAPEARSLKAVGIAVAGGIASGAAGAIASDLLGKRSEPAGLMVDTETGVIYMNTPDAPEARSLKAVGIAVAGGIASGAAGAIASDLLGKRAEHPAPTLVIDNETGAIYLDKPDLIQERSFAAVGKAIASDVAAGIAESGAAAAIKNFFRRDAGDIYMDEAGTIFIDTGDAEKRSLKAIGIAVAGGIASGAAGAIASDLLSKRLIDELD